MGKGKVWEAACVSPCCNELLLRLIAVNQDDLYRYIYSLVPSEADSRDILQETLLAISRKFDLFQSDFALRGNSGRENSGGPFLPWACRFAYYEVLRLRVSIAPAPLFCQRRAGTAGSRAGRSGPAVARKAVGLGRLLGKLPAADRKLLRGRYASKLTLDEVAARVKQSRRTLLRNLKRLRQWLHDCVERQPEMREL